MIAHFHFSQPLEFRFETPEAAQEAYDNLRHNEDREDCDVNEDKIHWYNCHPLRVDCVAKELNNWTVYMSPDDYKQMWERNHIQTLVSRSPQLEILEADS